MIENAILLEPQNSEDVRLEEAKKDKILELCREYLRQTGKSAEMLELREGMTARAARKILDGETKNPSWENLVSLARACGVRVMILTDD